MGLDQPAVLCTWAQFTAGAFNDLARNYTDASGQDEILAESTRLIEQSCDRRLVPFTITESLRATGVDPDEYPNPGLPTSQAASLGMSQAGALGTDDGVRHVWVTEYAARNQDLWTYTDVAVTVETTYGGTAAATVSGPEPDSGHMWFRLGTFCPVGSLVRVRYSGGYTVAIPADLQRAGKLMTAALVMRELIPNKQTRDPAALWDEAVKAAAGYVRG